VNAPRKSALLFERADDGGLRAGEWRRGVDGETRIACPRCGCPQVVEHVEQLWCCNQESCELMCWVELLPAKPT
jgi:hypothetical protein